MKKYELMLVLRSDAEKVKAGIDNVKAILSKNGGIVESEKDYGAKVLAYDIDKENHAQYHLLNINLDPSKVVIMEEEFKFSKELIRHLFVAI